MFGIQNVQLAAPSTQSQMKAPEPTETAVAVTEISKSEKSRNDGMKSDTQDQQTHSGHKDPDEELPDLLGPPPSFSANVLEADRARLSEPLSDQGQTQTEQSTKGYDGIHEDAARQLDVSR